MKKVICSLTGFFAAIAVMTGCSSDKSIDVRPVDSKVPLTFILGGVKSHKTKAAPILGTEFPTGHMFNIWGFNKAEDTDTEYDMFLDGVSAWVNNAPDQVDLYGGPYYWPVTASSVFLCLYVPPYVNGSNHPSVSFDVPGDPTMTVYYTADSFEGAQDVLYANVGDPTPDEPIELVFKHMLARITFQCQLVNDISTTSVKFKSITLKNVYTQGKFGIDSVGLTIYPNDGVPGQPREDIVAEIAADDAKELRGTSGNSGDLVDSPGADIDGYTNVFADYNPNNSFLVIYHYQSPDLEQVDLDLVITIDGKDVSFTIRDLSRFGVNWMPGEHINYRLTLDVRNAKPQINVSSVIVEEWSPPSNVGVNINVNDE